MGRSIAAAYNSGYRAMGTGRVLVVLPWRPKVGPHARAKRRAVQAYFCGAPLPPLSPVGFPLRSEGAEVAFRSRSSSIFAALSKRCNSPET